jgi:hypothetical protein
MKEAKTMPKTPQSIRRSDSNRESFGTCPVNEAGRPKPEDLPIGLKDSAKAVPPPLRPISYKPGSIAGIRKIIPEMAQKPF